ncbi:hypothetical protein [Spirosoma sp. KCTC 42546]|uniref:hypothetical protein n=1 Tax=Spirosoma sp. KCTC 42546 TaxID=2520506 RepID=UPI00143CC371|nr:hypothetical protein [Spirosoma sp. KCTC 42546]
MNPEMKSVLSELIAELEVLRLKTNSLVGHVDGSHPDARQITEATGFIQDAIKSLQKIGFGLESETSYDD